MVDWINNLPAELLLEIAESLGENLYTLASLVATTRRAKNVLEQTLYDTHVRTQSRRIHYTTTVPRSLSFGAWNNLPATIEKSVAAMGRVSRGLGGTGMDVNTISSHLGERQEEFRDRHPPFDIHPSFFKNLISGKDSALHIACIRGNNNAVRKLLELGADVNLHSLGMCEHHGLDGWRPLHFALCREHSTTAEILIEAGASYLTRSTVLDHEDIPYGRGVPIGAIHDASRGANSKWLFDLIRDRVRQGGGDWAEHGGPVDNLVNSMTPWGTPLQFGIPACDWHNTKHLTHLVNLGADVNVISRFGSPLKWAIDQGFWPAALFLLDHGARVPVDEDTQRDHLVSAIWSHQHSRSRTHPPSLCRYSHPLEEVALGGYPTPNRSTV